MSDILSERHADQEVIKNLLKEIARLKGLIMSQTEGKLLLDINGNIYLSTQHSLVSESGVAEKVEEAKKQIAEFEEVKKMADRLQGPTDNQPAAETQPEPTPTPAPTAPVDQPVPAPQQSEPAAPVASPEVPVNPASPIIVQ